MAQQKGVIRIAKAPAGQAPLHIREKWIGVEIPFIDKAIPQGDVVNVPDLKLMNGGEAFIVDQHAALEALRKKSPQVASWWTSAGYPMPGGQFPFNVECAELVA